MVNIYNYKIEQPSLEFIRFNWIIEPTLEDLSLYNFIILRSNSPEGPFDQIATVNNQFYYEDWEVNQYSQNRIYYYALRAVDSTGSHKDFGPYYLTIKPDPIALEMIRKKNISLNNGSTSGVNIEIFIRKTWGTYCNCFDRILKRKTISNCKICYDTNYRGGYFKPIKTRAFFNISTKTIQHIGFEIHPQNTMIEIANYPLVSPGDIVKQVDIRKNYRVNLVKPTTRSTYIVSQFLQLNAINLNDIEAEL